jgi:hypothetical protein
VKTIDLDTVGVFVAQDQLLRAMKRGTALVTYTGHSGPTSWTFSGLVSTKQVAHGPSLRGGAVGLLEQQLHRSAQ